METVLAGQRTTRRKARPQMRDYSQTLLAINILMKEAHTAATNKDFEMASKKATEVAKQALSLAAYFESKTELEI